jgi:hypothetical protein
MATKWTLLSGDVSGIPATFVRKIDATTFAVCELNAWEDLDSSAIETHGKYNVQSGTVDVLSDCAGDALRSCGWHMDAKTGNIVDTHSGEVVAAFESKHYLLVQVEAMWSYGAKDVACDVSGNNLRKLVREAKGAV